MNHSILVNNQNDITESTYNHSIILLKHIEVDTFSLLPKTGKSFYSRERLQKWEKDNNISMTKKLINDLKNMEQKSIS